MNNGLTSVFPAVPDGLRRWPLGRWDPPSSGFEQVVSEFGVALTAGASNTYGSRTVLHSSVPFDVRHMEIQLVAASDGDANSRRQQFMVSIDVDESGGSNWRTLVPHLISSGPSGGGDDNYRPANFYSLPVAVRSGSSLAVRASSSSSTPQASAIRVYALLYGDPTEIPDVVRSGSRVTAYGVVETVSSGTAVTLGADTFGSWTFIARTEEEHLCVVPGFAGTGGNFDGAAQVEASWGEYAGQNHIGRYIYDSYDYAGIRRMTRREARIAIPVGANLYVRGGRSQDANLRAAFYGVS